MALDFPSPATVGQVFQNWQWDGSEWIAANASLTYPVTVPQGGTGQTTLPLNLVLKGAGTAAIAASSITDAGSGVTIGSPSGGAAGAGSLALPGLLRINANAAALPAAVGGAPLLQIGNADAAATSILMDGFGAGASTSITGRHAMGTNAAKSPTSAGIGLLALNGGGYDGTAYSSGGQAQIALTALNTWSATDHSTNIGFSTTPSASTTMALRMILGQGLQISSVIGTDPGVGGLILNANAAALPAPLAGVSTLLQMGAADGQAPMSLLDAFGATNGIAFFRQNSGTAAAPVATAGGRGIGSLQFAGYDGTAYTAGRALITAANSQAAAWTSASTPTSLQFYTTASGSASPLRYMTLMTGLVLGSNPNPTDPGNGGLLLNANAAALPAGIAGMQLRVGQVDGTNCVLSMESFGSSAQSIFLTRAASGTAASLAAVASAANLLYIQAQGYNGAGWQQGAAIIASCTATWTTGATPTSLIFYATPPATTGVVQVAVMQAGIYVGAPTGLDKGAGTLNATGLYVNGTAVSVSDQRLKDDIEPSAEDALAVLRQIMLFDYTWRSTGPDDQAPRHDRCGFVAQQVPEQLRIPGPTPDDMVGVDTLQLLAHTVRAVQQVADRLDGLEAQVRTGIH